MATIEDLNRLMDNMQQSHRDELAQQRIITENLNRDMNNKINEMHANETRRSEEAAHQSDAMMKLLLKRDETTSKPKDKWSAKLTEKSYKRMEKFSGGEVAWQEWSYDFELITGALNPCVRKELTEAENKPRPMNDIRAAFIDDPEGNWEPDTRSKELLEVLILLTTGEARSLIRDAADGFVAWNILNKTYNRKALARCLRIYREAINP